MARVPQATSKTWQKIQIALINQPKNLDGTQRPTSFIVRIIVSFGSSWIRLGHCSFASQYVGTHNHYKRRKTIAQKANDTWLRYSVT